MRYRIIVAAFSLACFALAADAAEIGGNQGYSTFSSAQDAAPAPSSVADGTATDSGSSSGASGAASSSGGSAQDISNQTYNKDEVINAANTFFGENAKGLALVIEKAFSDYGKPVGYITGNEGSGALVVGLRYGSGTFTYKGGGSMPVYWQGPSIGFDFGGNASKVFTLVYNLQSTRDLFQRFPAVDGSLYVVAGLGMNYQRSDGIVLAPIRTGVGLRAGASLGYINYTRQQTVNPF